MVILDFGCERLCERVNVCTLCGVQMWLTGSNGRLSGVTLFLFHDCLNYFILLVLLGRVALLDPLGVRVWWCRCRVIICVHVFADHFLWVVCKGSLVMELLMGLGPGGHS